jgi:hypothetical protein
MRSGFRWLAVAGFVTCLPAASMAAPACGSTVGGPGVTVVLDGDVSPCTGTALFLAPGTVALDLGGFTISCSAWDPEGSQSGVNALGVTAPVEIRNGTVTGCRIGVQGNLDSRIVNMTINGGEGGFSGGSCESSTVSNANYAGFGLHRGKSRDCHGINNGQTGISINTYDNDRASLSDSTASGNGISGIVVYGSVALSNVVSENNGDAGFSVSSNGLVKIKDCTASENGGNGFRLATSDRRVKVSRSLAENNGEDGFFIFDGDVKLSGNIATGNVVAGFSSGPYVDRGRIKGNESLGNGVDMFDASATCEMTNWNMNTFGTSNVSCIE